MSLTRLIFIGAGLTVIWQAVVFLTGVPPYILPGPLRVASAAYMHAGSLLGHALTTFLEIVIGLMLGTVMGALSAMVMMASRSLKRWLLPVLVILILLGIIIAVAEPLGLLPFFYPVL